MRLLLVVTIGMELCQPQLFPNLCSETLADGAGGFLPACRWAAAWVWGTMRVFKPRPSGRAIQQKAGAA